VLATEMEVGPDGRLTGAIAGANVRGPEKARRLDEWLGGRGAVVYAYGDSEGDDDLLARADHPVRVDRRGRLPRDIPPVRVESGTSTAPTLR
jgi:phosphatidylglycerophosphatase C